MLHRRRVFTEPEARFFMVQLIGACHHMHTHQVIHRYLKLGSLFLNAGMSIKAGDFGLAALIESPGERKKTICGTPNYCAGGIARHCERTQFEVDIWSIGVILYTFILGRPPFQTKDVKEVFHDLEHRRASKKDEIARKHPAISPAAIRRVPADLFVQEIGILATQLVFESPTPLQTLKHPVHGFPRYATSLTRRIASQPGLLEEVSSNSYKIRPGVSAVWLNGVPVSPDEMNPVQPSSSTFDLITHPSFGTSSPRADATGGLFDSSERPLLTPAQLRTLAAILTCSQAPTVRRNMFNVRVRARPVSTSKPALHCERGLDAHPALLPDSPWSCSIVETEEGARMARVLYYLEKKYGRVCDYAILRCWESQNWTGPTCRGNSTRLVGSEEIKGGEELSFDVLAGHTSEFFEVRINKALRYYVLNDVRPAPAPSPKLHPLPMGAELS
ncbi:kinase-like domain-containing protein [Lactarius indigo]|nr:kinase-like domain-containing protein [Lactarius indigo]